MLLAGVLFIVGLRGNSAVGAQIVIPSAASGLRCDNDYLYTIRCYLPINATDSSPSNYAYSLLFRQEVDTDLIEEYACKLSLVGNYYFCALDKSLIPNEEDFHLYVFTEYDEYEIYLCRNVSDCEMLVTHYKPKSNITPVAPSGLSVVHKLNKYHFDWTSNYESYPLSAFLEYQLHYSVKGFEEKGTTLQEFNTNISVGNHNFAPNTEYVARVRSIPTRTCKGHWSEWSPAIYWRTDHSRKNTSANGVVPPLDKRVVIPLILLAPVLLLLCYAPIIKLRQSTHIPTPAPYFQSLYSDCQGDFKTWVVTPSNGEDLLESEETLQIDVLTKSALDTETNGEEQTIGDWTDQAKDAFLPGMPYAVTPGTSILAPGDPPRSLCVSSGAEKVTEGDSRCLLCSAPSLVGDGPWYSNEYCTLSDMLGAFIQAGATGHQCVGRVLGNATGGDYQN